MTDMMDIISTVEKTTRNARRIRYWQCTLGDGSIIQLAQDIQGRVYLDGKEITDAEVLKACRTAIATTQLRR